MFCIIIPIVFHNVYHQEAINHWIRDSDSSSFKKKKKRLLRRLSHILITMK